MKNYFYYFILSCFSLSFFACDSNQATTENTLEVDSSATVLEAATAPKTIESFVLEGHQVLNQSKADLNGDTYEDVILILKSNTEDKAENQSEEPILRPLLILAGDASGSFGLVARNDKVVFCGACGGIMGDPFDGIVAKKGEFSISFYGGSSHRWARNISFEYNTQQKDWLLKTDVSEFFGPDNSEKGEVVDNKKEATAFKLFDIYKDM